MLLHDGKNLTGHRAAFVKKFLWVQPSRFQYIQVNIAITNMSEPDDFKFRVFRPHQLVHIIKKLRHCRYADSDIILVWRKLCDSFGDILPQTPQVFSLSQALTNRAINNPALLQTVFEQLHRRLKILICTLLKLDQRIEIGLALKWPRQTLLRNHMLQGLLGKKFECRDG